MTRRTLVIVVGLLVGPWACGGETGIREERIPEIQVTGGQQVVSEDATVIARADLPVRIAVANTGTGDLVIREIAISSVPAGAFTIASAPMPSESEPVVVAPDGPAHAFTVAYDPQAAGGGGERPSAVVTIRTNLTLAGDNVFTLRVASAQSVSRLVVAPSILDFGEVEAEQQATLTANLLNTGNNDVAITRITMTGHSGYRALIAGVEYGVEAGGDGGALASPLTVPAGSALKVDVTFVAGDLEPAPARIVFETDDDASLRLELYANLVGPCVSAKPARLSFGGRLVGQPAEVSFELQSCGDVDLVVSAIDLVDDGLGVFSFDLARVATVPFTLPAGSAVLVPITYFPERVAEVVGGELVRDHGLVRVRSDAYRGELEVPIEGFGTDGSCPVATIVVPEGERVVPQTVLHLQGAGQSALGRSIAGYEWSVIQPAGSVSLFSPSAEAQSPSFEANIAGDYIFRLTVTDSAGVPSCAPAEYTVTVIPEDAIHVELVWRTPGDPDESDTGGDQVAASAGSDVDLHFMHPNAFGIWFAPDYDCYWDNPNCEWGAPGALNNARLDRDDTDGGGPENLNLNTPENDTRYRVGVHYWNHWGYGPAFATVNVYVYGVLRERWGDVELVHDDLWDVFTIDWPSRVITRVGEGEPVITPKFREAGPGG